MNKLVRRIIVLLTIAATIGISPKKAVAVKASSLFTFVKPQFVGDIHSIQYNSFNAAPSD